MKKADIIQEFEVLRKRVIKAIKEHPESEAVLITIFPEIINGEKVFARLGCILKSKKHPRGVYALIKWNGEVRFLNITFNTFWKSAVMKVSELSDLKGETITVWEFSQLVDNHDDFEVIDI